MNAKYDPKKIEPKWQKYWETKKLFHGKTGSKKKKFYALVEFPYPSGEGLHTGHVRGYTAMDIVARKRRMEGFETLYPIGWDAFGLPTENFAIKTGIHPEKVTKKNTDTFRTQMKSLGFSFDWSREISTTNPEYYKWTQWIFLQLFKKGLAYKAKMNINWCPSCKIGLANEEAIGGVCERCGKETETREKEQWMLAITKYADRLDKDLNEVDYVEKIKVGQRNWIGRSEGTVVKFKIKNEELKNEKPWAGVGFLMQDSTGKLLFQKRDMKVLRDPGMITPFGGGRYNEDESPVECVKRECREELGTSLVSDQIAFIGDFSSKNTPRETIKMFFVSGVRRKDLTLLEGEKIVSSTPEEALLDKNFTEFTKEVIRFHQSRQDQYIEVFTTRVDTIYGCTYVVVAPEHSIFENKELGIKNQAEIREYIDAVKKKTEQERNDATKEKTGVKLEGIEAVNLFTGEAVPVFVADYVLGNYGTGAVMAVPAHDIRDMEFATKYGLDVKAVVVFSGQKNQAENTEVFVEDGVLVHSGEFTGLKSEEAREKMTAWLTKKKLGKRQVNYRLRDWVFSRQRYWGEPIPMVKCETCGWVPISEKDLPLKLPKVKSYIPTDIGESPLAGIEKWVKTTCPKCGGPARRETDTMPNWAGSSWYYLAYVMQGISNSHPPAGGPISKYRKTFEYWTPVDWYNGGMEHTTLHLLYSRFWHKVLYDIGVVPTKEPYQKRTSHGLILAEGGVKMSKSKGNVVNPDDIVRRFGADTLRVYEMFMGPFDQDVAWSTESISGSRRFLEKVWRLQERITNEELRITNEKFLALLHKTIKKVSEDIEGMRFNTAISALMILANEMERAEFVAREEFETFLILLAPFAPHIAEELWSLQGNKKSLMLECWPKANLKFLTEETAEVIVQVNGKLRARLRVSVGASEEEVERRAREEEVIKKYLDNSVIRKVIFVPDRLVNFVV